MSRISSGQPETAGPGVDKWAALDALTLCAGAFGLTHRALGVLRALMTFLPGREIGAEDGAAVVFPSNRTLASRLGGMPESTLRRHLAALCASGLVRRQDSANRKRYARSIGGGIALAFGFDLAPLAQRGAEIAQAAEAARQRAERIAVLRDEIGLMRLALIEAGEADAAEDIRRALRRKPEEATLRDLRDRLTRLLTTHHAAPARTPESGGADSGNERHIHASETPESEKGREAEVTPAEIARTCREYRAYFPDTPPDWPGLLASAARLAPMLGIDRAVLAEAGAALGPRGLATSVLCILERGPTIRVPGAYLRRLSRAAEEGRFSARRMLDLVRRQEELSADNPCLAGAGVGGIVS